MIPRIALVTHALPTGGGVATVTRFLYQVLEESGRYEPEIISLSTSARDECSVRLLSPATWAGGPQVRSGEWRELPYRHVGARWTEIETQRYQPRAALSEQLRTFDLIQVVAGTPSWAHAVIGLDRPVALQVATLIAVERVAALKKRT